MKSQYILSYSLIVFFLFTFSSLNAQTKVTKISAAKSNDYGIEYFLPKTILKIDVEYSKITQKAGQYARYAEKYLGIKEADAILEDNEHYILDNMKVEPVGIPDRDAGYIVELKPKTTAPFVYLTEEGLICTINAEYTPETKVTEKSTIQNQQTQVNIDPHSIFTEEYLRAGSVSKMAEVLAKQIFKIRESRNDILTGAADNAPRDGEGIRILLANLEAQEKALVELFTGTSSVEKKQAQFELEPLSDINREILFRFSKFGGVVDSDDLSGSPVYINVRAIDVPEEIAADPKKKKEEKGIFYNVPGKAQVEIYFGVNLLYNKDIQICQFGKKQLLATSLFEDKKTPVQVLFYPNTGAVKQIIQ